MFQRYASGAGDPSAHDGGLPVAEGVELAAYDVHEMLGPALGACAAGVSAAADGDQGVRIGP